MSLSCSCDDGGEWWYYGPKDYITMPVARRKRCVSCRELIGVGAVATRFDRGREPCSWVEESIHGSDGVVDLPPKFMCERCSDLYFSLTDLGFCITLGDEMRELVREYAEVYGPKKSEPRSKERQ